jgi:hypothetical protein
MEIRCLSLDGEKSVVSSLNGLAKEFETSLKKIGSLGEVLEKFWRRESHFKGENLADCLEITGTVIAEVVLDTD